MYWYHSGFLFTKAMKLAGLSKSTHYLLQSHYTCPAINAEYEKEEARMLAKYKGKEIVIAGL